MLQRAQNQVEKYPNCIITFSVGNCRYSHFKCIICCFIEENLV